MALTALASLAQHWLDFDTQFTLWVNSLHCSFCDVFMPLFSARFSWVPFYVGLAYLIVRNFTWRTALLLLFAVALLITACDQVSSAVLRPLIERLRPCDFDNPIHDAVLVVDDYRPQSYSCPSAHAANTWALTSLSRCSLFRRRDGGNARWLCLFGGGLLVPVAVGGCRKAQPCRPRFCPIVPFWLHHARDAGHGGPSSLMPCC